MLTLNGRSTLKNRFFIVLYNDSINYFTICFKHQCNTMHFQKAAFDTIFNITTTTIELQLCLWVHHQVCCDKYYQFLSKAKSISVKSCFDQLTTASSSPGLLKELCTICVSQYAFILHSWITHTILERRSTT